MKPEKFPLEMKSNFNQENDHPLASLKKNSTGFDLQRSTALEINMFFSGYTVVYFFFS